MTSNAENVSIWWRHPGINIFVHMTSFSMSEEILWHLGHFKIQGNPCSFTMLVKAYTFYLSGKNTEPMQNMYIKLGWLHWIYNRVFCAVIIFILSLRWVIYHLYLIGPWFEGLWCEMCNIQIYFIIAAMSEQGPLLTKLCGPIWRKHGKWGKGHLCTKNEFFFWNALQVVGDGYSWISERYSTVTYGYQGDNYLVVNNDKYW